MKLAIIADDFTGANDTGVQFSKKGLSTVVTTNLTSVSGKIFENDVVVFDTESRFDEKDIAYQKVFDIAKLIKNAGTELVYKKLDSTFRGNIGAEISGCMDGLGMDFAIVIPALPSNGRQTIDGNVILHGQKLDETEIANDPKTPVKKAYIPNIIADQSNKTIEVVRKGASHYETNKLVKAIESFRNSDVNIVVIDAETDEDLKILSEMLVLLRNKFLMVGTAGLAEYITQAYQLKEIKAVLSVIGSVSDVTRRQITYAQERNNLKIMDMTVQDMFDEEKKEVMISACIQYLKAGEHVVIRTAREQKDIQAANEYAKKEGMTTYEISDYIAKTLGEVTGVLLSEASQYLSGVFITGGDTLIKIANQLKIEGMTITEEVLPAIPAGRFIHNRYNNIDIVTKAGAFGNDETFNYILEYLGR